MQAADPLETYRAYRLEPLLFTSKWAQFFQEVFQYHVCPFTLPNFQDPLQIQQNIPDQQ